MNWSGVVWFGAVQVTLAWLVLFSACGILVVFCISHCCCCFGYLVAVAGSASVADMTLIPTIPERERGPVWAGLAWLGLAVDFLVDCGSDIPIDTLRINNDVFLLLAFYWLVSCGDRGRDEGRGYESGCWADW